MKYKTKYDSYDFLNEDDLLTRLLENRGISDIHSFLRLSEDVIHNGMLLHNMREGLRLFYKYIHIKAIKNKEKLRIHVIVDPDMDGYGSACLIIRYIRDLCNYYNNDTIEITYSFHKGKQHGIILKNLEQYDFDLLISPDGGTNDVESCKQLKEQGKDIIILDHHKIEKENPYATVINCQDGIYPNTELSGVGVVYKFCKEYDRGCNCDFADKYLDLVALGQIGDQVDLRSFETRYLTLKGIDQFGKYNTLLQEIMIANEYQIQNKINIKKIGWNIAPFFNAVNRIGTQDNKKDLFRALLGEQETKIWRGRATKNNPNPKEEDLTLQQFTAKEIKSIKSRQDGIVTRGVKEIDQYIQENKLDDNKIVLLDSTEYISGDFTGLVANKLAEKYKRPTVLLKKRVSDNYDGLSYLININAKNEKKDIQKIETITLTPQDYRDYIKQHIYDSIKLISPRTGEKKINELTDKLMEEMKSSCKATVVFKKENILTCELLSNRYGGSGRNYELFPLKDLRSFLIDCDIFNYVSGHDNSFGVGIQSNKVKEIIPIVNEKLKNVAIEDVYYVDYEIPVGRLKENHIKQISEWKDMWGGKLSEPLFAITDIYIPTSKITLRGEKKNFLTFENRGIKFKKPFASKEFYNKMVMKKDKGLSSHADRIKLDVIGKFVVNEWNGNCYAEVEIVDFNVTEDNEIMF